MNTLTRYPACTMAVLLLLCIPACVWAVPDSTTTYTITIGEDGTALWQVDYRTLLATDDDLDSFANYTRDLPSVYLPQVKDLMQRSAAQAAVATSRYMQISNISGDAVIQTSPTGRYGVIMYSFRWTGFAQPGSGLSVGDAFTGGLYLAKDNTLIIRYPAGWTATRVEPQPDLQREGLVWYGLRSFGAGEPRIMLEKSSFPLIPAVIGLVIIIGAGSGYLLYWIRKRSSGADEPEDPAIPLSETDEESLEERIVSLLRANGGEQFQSEIVKLLGLPKSTVSSTLNNLHRKGIIRKVKKGRENLIRLVNSCM